MTSRRVAKDMALVRKIMNGLRWPRVLYRLGYIRVWLQSRLFPLSKGRFPPVWLAAKSAFPSVWKMDGRPHGLLAIGGAITEDMLLAAYAKGVHPFCDQHPIRWVAFNPRMVLFPERTRLGKGIRPIIRSGRFNITFDRGFEDVVRGCSERSYTWLVPERIAVAVALHKRGQAHSVEVWDQDGRLVGGLFGVDMGRVFIGESAFSNEPNAMKVAFAYLNCHLQNWGYGLHDAQMYGKHLERMGFEEIPRKEYGRRFRQLVDRNVRCEQWKVDENLDVAEWIPSSPGSQIRKPVSGR